MEVISQVEAKSFTLSNAILLHSRETRREDGYGQGGTKQSCFATVHPVRDDGKGGKVVGEGQLLTRGGLHELVEQMAPERGLRFLPPEVLATCGSGLVWWRRAAPAKVWFNTRDSLGQKVGVTPQPGLIFAATEGGWWVWAVKGDERPTPATKLYQAPHYNVNSAGAICTGNAELPKTLHVEAIAGYEDAFWSSRFTHPNVHEKRRLCKWRGGAEKLWESLLAGRHKSFPQGALVELGMDVATMIGRVAGKVGSP